MQTRIPFIILGKGQNQRKIVVINRQPFYQSTGINSHHKDVWFPFEMLKGSIPLTNADLAKITCINEEGKKDLFNLTNDIYQLITAKGYVRAQHDYVIKYRSVYDLDVTNSFTD